MELTLATKTKRAAGEVCGEAIVFPGHQPRGRGRARDDRQGARRPDPRAAARRAAKDAGKVCVCELVPLFDVSQPTVSHHLKVLRNAGLVACERRGLWSYYYVLPGGLAALRAGWHDRRARPARARRGHRDVRARLRRLRRRHHRRRARRRARRARDRPRLLPRPARRDRVARARLRRAFQSRRQPQLLLDPPPAGARPRRVRRGSVRRRAARKSAAARRVARAPDRPGRHRAEHRLRSCAPDRGRADRAADARDHERRHRHPRGRRARRARDRRRRRPGGDRLRAADRRLAEHRAIVRPGRRVRPVAGLLGLRRGTAGWRAAGRARLPVRPRRACPRPIAGSR